jgi:hypothetical protein
MQKIFKAVYDSQNSVDIPEGYSIENTIYSSDICAVFVLKQVPPVDARDYTRSTGYPETYRMGYAEPQSSSPAPITDWVITGSGSSPTSSGDVVTTRRY